MVATRHSIPSTAGDESPPPAPNNRKAINALKKLRIAGKRTLIGDKKEEEEQAVETYHYRGGIYARTAKTPSQWVENQPMRYRKQTSEMRDNEASEAEQEDEDKEGPRIPTRKRARVVSLGSAEEPAPKRTRRSAPEAYNAISLNDHDSVGEDTPRRTRRTLPDVYYGHPKRRPSDSTGNTPRRRRRTRAEEEISIPNSILYDYAVVGGKDQKSCQEAARDRAIYMGWDVAPIENRFSKDSTANRRARAVAKDIVHLIHVNTELDKFYTEYQVASKNLEASKDRQKQGEAEKVADEVDAEILRAGIASEPPGASTAEPHVDTPRARTASPRSARQQQDPHEQTPPSNEPKASHQDGSLAETESSVDRHDSAASFSPSSVSKIPSMDHEFADPNLPDKNSTGQKLRWSLPTSVTNEDRAEAGIHRGRLEGESRSARRRRIKREHKMMNGWDVKTDASSQRGREDRGGSSQPGADDNDSLYHRD